MPQYFEVFGDEPRLSRHAWLRMRQRKIPFSTFKSALLSQPVLGTTEGTVICTDGEIEVVVDAQSGVIVTLWWSE